MSSADSQHGWAGGANEEEPDLDLLLALSGGAKTNNPFGFEKVGKGASGRPRRQFEDEGDFYVPSL
jgi:hypothetical protein